jgi:hypothetical protein
MEMGRVVALVVEHGSPMSSATHRKSDREIDLRALRMAAAGVALFLIGALVSVAGKRVFHQDDVTTLGIFLLVFGMIMGVFAIARGLWSRTKALTPARFQANTQAELQPPKGQALPGTPSVTESTTRIMDTDPSLRAERHLE